AATAARATELLRAALAGNAAGPPIDAAVKDVVTLVAPVLVAVAATSALATVVQTGALFAPARLAPDLTKLDPIAGLRSLVSGTRLWSVARALVATMAVGWLAWSAFGRHVVDLAHAVGSGASAVAVAGFAARRLARDAAMVGLAFAIVDLVVVRRALHAK